MQKAGIPITFTYIADAHDDHNSGFAFGPGQPGYVAALKAYDDAFAKFFTQLKQNGIDQSNTLFVVTADEGDHFSGSAPTVYIRNNPAPTAPVTRQLERDMAKLTALNPLTNQLDTPSL
jgi:hypothetical protein